MVYPRLSTCHKLPYLLALTSRAVKAIEPSVVKIKYMTVLTTPTQPLHDTHRPQFGLVPPPCSTGVHLAIPVVI